MRSGRPAFLLDGDNLRHGLNADLGFSDRDRTENVRRAGEVAAMFAEAGSLALIAFICPFAEDRQLIRNLHEQAGLPFAEIFVDTSIDECERRDPRASTPGPGPGSCPASPASTRPTRCPPRPDLVLGSRTGSSPSTFARVGLLEVLLRYRRGTAGLLRRASRALARLLLVRAGLLLHQVDYSWTSSIRVPNEVLGCTKATVVPRDPGRGASSMTRPPAS